MYVHFTYAVVLVDGSSPSVRPIRIAERVPKMPYPTPPTSLRLSAPLLEALECDARPRDRRPIHLWQNNKRLRIVNGDTGSVTSVMVG